MQSIVFTVRDGIEPGEQDRLLGRLQAIPGIHRAAALSPRAKNPETRRMYYAYLTDGADPEAVRGRIAAQPEVENAALPAQRGLA